MSISGYHIAEAGANPITQLAFTLANGFTYVESYLARGMHDRRFRPEPLVLLLERHGSGILGHRPGRAPHLGGGHARTLRRERALARSSSTTCRPRAARCTRRRWRSTTSAPRCRRCAPIYDNCNSLHTNAYDEAVTTPTEESVRRAMAIQLIINRGVGPGQEREPAPGQLHHRGADRPGRGGGAEGVRRDRRARRRARARWRPATSAARSRTNRCSTSTRSTTAACPSSASTPSAIRPPRRAGRRIELARSTEAEKQSQLAATARFPARATPAEAPAGLERLRQRGDRERQHLRRADGRRARAARSGRSPNAVRGRRALPPQHVMECLRQ